MSLKIIWFQLVSQKAKPKEMKHNKAKGIKAWIFHACFLLLLASVFVTSAALDTLAVNQSITDRLGETLVSADGSYELGFFSPGNSTKRYVGMWYKKITNRTVVWVANRNVALTDTYGVLKVDQSGMIVLLNQSGVVIWHSNASRPVQNPVAQLLDTGNFVVRNENDSTENFLWQSFHYPVDSLLPGMRIGLTAGLYLYLSSWKSSEDPAVGDFTFKLDTKGLESVIREGSAITSRSGPWNGNRFSGTPYLKVNSMYKYSMIVDQNDRYYTYQLVNGTVITRLVLYPNGVMDRMTWVDRINNWVVYLAAPVDNCDTYALCGNYGSCNIANSPGCGCLERFVPKSQENWYQSDWSGGCVRRTQLDNLDCKKDGFIKYSNLKLPDTQYAMVNASMTLEECRFMCLNNCSCIAYANMYITNGGTGCFLWSGALLDIKQFSEFGQDLYIRMASSDVGALAHSSLKRHTWIILVSVLSAGMVLLVLGIILVLQSKNQRKQQFVKFNHNSLSGERESSFRGSLSGKYQVEDMELPLFDMTTIAHATSNFSFGNIIGEGGFGPVYKGVLQEGQQIAVKRLSKDSRQGIDEFKNEVNVIAKLQHRNLVKLVGYCIQTDERMLIYEYMPNKSLDFYIFDQTRSKSLDWPMRYQIVHGISRGLLYLHQDSRLRIIHRDLKLSNILLDNDMKPKISDFGMARSFMGNESAANTKRVVGTYGYMSPEYTIDGLFSTKSDVFSFGVMVLEIVSGRRNWGFNDPNHQLNLLGHAWRLFNEGRFMELIDGSIVETCIVYEVLRSVHVGLLCVQNWPEDRPSMSAVVLMLAGEGILPQPKEPGFFTERIMIDTKSSSSKYTPSSVNDLTITTLEVR